MMAQTKINISNRVRFEGFFQPCSGYDEDDWYRIFPLRVYCDAVVVPYPLPPLELPVE
jgi:hypothetical protein